MAGWVELVAGIAGSLLGALVYVAVCVLVIYQQFREYRNHWNQSSLSWWVIKLATPAVIAAIVLLSLALFDTTGMEGLAAFYVALFAALLLAPLLITRLAKVLGVPPADSIRASGSLVLCLVVGWFAVAGAGNNLTHVRVDNLDGRAEYIAFRRAAENAPPATGEIALAARDVMLLPDGSRLVHLEFAIQSGYRIHTVDVRTLRTHPGGNSASFNSTLGGCATPGKYHMTTVLHEAESFDVRLRFHAGTPESMVEFAGDYHFPLSERTTTGALVLEYGGDALYTPVPLPAYAMTLFVEGGEIKADQLLPPQEERVVGMHPGSRCLVGPLPLVFGLDRVMATLYSEERYRKLQFDLPIRRLD